MVTKVWESEKRGRTPLQKWQFKIQRRRRFLRGWAKNISGSYKKEKESIIKKADELDKRAENQTLSDAELDPKNCLKQRLVQMLREEEIK